MAGIVFSKSSGLNDSIFGKSAEPIMMFIEKKAEAFEQQSVIPKLFKEHKSKKFGEKITSMTSFNGFQPVGEGGAYPKDEIQESYSKFLEHETWKDQFVVTREMMEDKKMMDLNAKSSGFISGFYRTRERFGAALIASGTKETATFNSKGFDTTGADKQPLFSTQHPSILKENKKVQSNMFKDAFSVDALSALESKMQDFRDDNENILSVAPDTILIPNDWKLKKAVFEAIGADKDPETANNGFNYQFGRWNVIVWNYLNQFITKGSAPWYLIDSHYNNENGGALWLNRVPLEVKTWVDDNNDNNVWNGYSRFIAGFNDWRFAAVGGIADGDELITA